MSGYPEAEPPEGVGPGEDEEQIVGSGSLQGYGPFENPESGDDGAESSDAEERSGWELPQPSRDLGKSIQGLDALLASADDEEKVKAGMGIRLALGMAQELKNGKPLGSETSEMVSGWVNKYGRDAVDAAIKVAREFLIKPEEMRMTLGRNLGLGKPE